MLDSGSTRLAFKLQPCGMSCDQFLDYENLVDMEQVILLDIVCRALAELCEVELIEHKILYNLHTGLIYIHNILV